MPEHDSSQSGDTSMSLLERVRQRDQDAWRRLVQLYSPLVFSWAVRSGLGGTDAADLVQEVWLSAASALQRLSRDRAAGTFRGWLWTITKNKATDYFRKRS